MKKVFKLTESQLKKTITNIVLENIKTKNQKEKKVLRLKESEFKNLIKNIIKEVEMDPEPVMTGEKVMYFFIFNEGGTKIISFSHLGPEGDFVNAAYMGMVDTNKVPQFVVNDMVQKMSKRNGTFDVIKEFYNNPQFPIPQFMRAAVGTSSTGTGGQNSIVAEKRLQFLNAMLMKAFDSQGFDSSRIKQFVTNLKGDQYVPSKIDKNLFDPAKVGPNPYERFGIIEIDLLTKEGLEYDELGDVESGLSDAYSNINTKLVDNVDEDTIVDVMLDIKSPSDLKKVNDFLQRSTLKMDLESYLNDQLFDDPNRMNKIIDHLINQINVKFKKTNAISKRYDGSRVKIVINL